jgi:hypothetical protein
MMVAMALTVGCVEQEPPSGPIADCRKAATETCESIGYGDNELCFLAFAKNCSPEDAARAQATCRQIENISDDSDCDLRWR